MRYITPDGTEGSVESIPDCAAAIRSGALTGESLVHDPGSDRWIKASEHKDIAALLTGSQPKRGKPTEPATEATASNGLRVAAWMAWILGLGVPPIMVGAQGGNAAFAFGEAIGAALFCVLIGAIALIFVKTPRSKLVLSLVLGLLLCAAELPRLIQQQADTARLHSSARNLQSALTSRTTAVNPPSAATTPTAGSNTSGAPVAQSETAAAASLLDVTADLVKDNKRIAEEYKGAIAALEAKDMATPGTLLNESRLHAASQRLNAWSAYLDSYEQELNEVRTNYVSKVEALDLPQSDRDAFHKSYSASKEKADEKIQRFLHIERSMIREVRALYAFMGDRIGLVQVSNGQLNFPTTADADAYNAHLDRLTKLAEQEALAQSDIVKMNTASMSRMQDFAKRAAGE